VKHVKNAQTPAKAHPATLVDPTWIKTQMRHLNMAISEIVNETGFDEVMVSAWIKGIQPMSQAVRTMFFLYFKLKELSPPKTAQ